MSLKKNYTAWDFICFLPEELREYFLKEVFRQSPDRFDYLVFMSLHGSIHSVITSLINWETAGDISFWSTVYDYYSRKYFDYSQIIKEFYENAS
jgi:hypothetical protein